MNQLTHHDFRSFETELLDVDFISINIKKFEKSEIYQLAAYFQKIGFNCYEKDRQRDKTRTPISTTKSEFEVIFILNVSYQPNVIQLQFPGPSGNNFYQKCKSKKVNWKEFIECDPVLTRLDLVYQRKNLSIDKTTVTEFINSSFIEFQTDHPRKNLQVEKNQKGLVFKIGSRKSQKYYRLYTKNNFLRFEFEIKGNIIQDFQPLLLELLLEQRFEEFERKLSFQFFKHSFELFHFATQTSHLDWLIGRLRTYQYRNISTSQKQIIPSHYIKQSNFKKFQDKLDFITFLQLIRYVQGLDYQSDSLGFTPYRLVRLRVQDFLDYIKRSDNSNYRQMKKLIKFFDQLQQNSLIQVFSDDYYRGIVTIPEVNLFKASDQSWTAEIWIAEELFLYLHPFLFNDLFQDKLTTYQFQVYFEIVKIFSSTNITKEFNFQQFIDSYTSALNGRLKKEIKEHFIQYLQVLESQGKIQAKVLLLPSNERHNIHQLTNTHLRKNKTIVAFEIIDIKFI